MPTINLMNMTPEEIAMGAARGTARGAVDSSYRSLVPVMPTAPSLPARPVYTEPAKEVFDWNVPVSERPAGTENWIWSKSRWAKDNWDREQQAKADAAYKQYQLDLMAWQDEAERKQREYEQQATAVKNYYDTQGLVAPLPGDPTPIIRQAGAEWQKAKAAGNQQAMNYWHGVAEQARIGAGWGSGGADGSLTARYMTNAGLPTWERQYKDTAYQDALKQQELENAMKVAALAAKGRGGGSGSGGGSSSASADFPYYLDTQGERANVMTGSLLERAEAQYQLNRQRGGSAGKNPLYYTLNTLFNNPEWQRAATSSGADIKKVADYLIVKYAKMSPVDYFNTGKASGTSVAAAYKQLLTQEEQDRFYSPGTAGKKQSSKGSFLNIFK